MLFPTATGKLLLNDIVFLQFLHRTHTRFAHLQMFTHFIKRHTTFKNHRTVRLPTLRFVPYKSMVSPIELITKSFASSIFD